MVFFTWNVAKSVQSSWKQRVVLHRDQVTHPLFTSFFFFLIKIGVHDLQNVLYFP